MPLSPYGNLHRNLGLATAFAWALVGVSSALAGARLGPLNVTRNAGTTLEVSLGFTSTEEVTCAQFDLLYNPARVTPGEVATSTGASGHEIASNPISAGRRRIVLYSTSLEPLQGGYIVSVPLTWLADGDSGLEVTAVTLASPAPAAVAFTSSALTPAIASSAGSGGPVGGSFATLDVEPTVGSGVSYQWKFNGEEISGANSASLTLRSAQHFNAGTYTVIVTANGLVLNSQSFDLAVRAPAPNNARLMNLATRALAQTGDSILIPGFVLGGSGTKRILIRGVGPTLGAFGVSGTLADPQMNIVSHGSVLASNDDWGTNSNKAALISTAAAVGAFDLVDGSKDAALLVDLPPGEYTVPTSGVAGGAGVAIVELYDADTGAPPTNLVNISNRGFVGVGDNVMIPGIVVSNEGPRTFLIRAVGPTLGAFGVGGVLDDPVLTVFSGQTPILSNDDWSTAPGATVTSSTAATVGAFPLNAGTKDAAFVVTLPPGPYTVQATGKNNTTGIALVEVYLVP